MTAARSSSSHHLAGFPRQRRTEPVIPHRLRLQVRRPTPDTAVVVIAGELDRSTAPRLAELLTSRLRGTLRRLVLDLSEVDTLDTEGASVLAVAELRARQRGIEFDVVHPASPAAVSPQRRQDQ